MSGNCIHGKQCLYAYADNAYCLMCDSGEYFKPMTNADRIRAMTDEELADFINDAEFGFLNRPGICDVCHTLRRKDCLSCWLDWLKADAEGEDNG